MKQELLYGLAALALSLSTTDGWAARVRPTNLATTPTAGASYYIYNVESELFMANQSYGAYLAINETPIATELTQLESGEWTLKFAGNSHFFWCSGSDVYTEYYYSDDSSPYNWWTINSTEENTYTIQMSQQNYYYDANSYLGWREDYSAYGVYANSPAEGKIHWQFIPANESGDRYVAALKLYKALELTNGRSNNLYNYYEDLYANRATSDIDEMTQAALDLRLSMQITDRYIFPYWNEYPIFWTTSEGAFGDSEYSNWSFPYSANNTGKNFIRRVESGTSTLSAVVDVDEAATIIYETNGPSEDYNQLQVYVDDKLVRTLTGSQISTSAYVGCRFSEFLSPGKHTIKWEVSSTRTGYFYVQNIGVVKSPLINVSMLEPGSLGTEVLYNTDHIKNVRRLKVKGTLNDDDFAKIKMMAGLLDLDLSEATFKEVPAKQFCVSYDNDSTMQFLHRLVLPEGVEKIGDEAFYNSFIDTLALPSTLKSIGLSAFNSSHIQELVMPDDCTDIYGAEQSTYYPICSNMKWLKKLEIASNLTMIPASTFSGCDYLEDVTLPEKLEVIGQYAFYYNKRMTITFPEGLKRICRGAFSGCTNTKFGSLPESLDEIQGSAFEGCHGLKNVELNVKQYHLADYLFRDCPNIETLRLNSPTVVTLTDNASYYPIEAERLAHIDLIVPSFLVNAYKLDKYWYNFKSVTGFSTAEIKDWIINRPLVLNHDRFDGTPNITINGDHDRMPSLKFNGTAAQDIDNLTIGSSVYYWDGILYPGQIYSNGENIRVNGDVVVSLFAPEKTWQFFSLPFDCKISDLTFSTEDVQYSIAYYDGANRAIMGTTGSWKNYDKANDVIAAGTGFILQTNKETWCNFKAEDNAMKQNIVAYREFSKTLQENAADVASNAGWNLVGNPYQCYYNDHALNFTAPITVWDANNRNYVAYSITDDDYAIRPNEAFFVQCPSAKFNTITFPLQGRQFNDVIESQNAARSFDASVRNRQLVNLSLTADQSSDRTRIVLNEQASLGYEMNCDASKFMSIDNNVSQLYSLDGDEIQYAINERPMDNSHVSLGYYAAKSGSMTISLNRCDAETVLLIDHENDSVTDLSLQSYTFSSEAGTFGERFTLVFDAEKITGIEKVTNHAHEGVCYNLNGQRAIGNNLHGIFIIDGKKVVK